MALGARKREARGGNVQPTPLNREGTGITDYGKRGGPEETVAKNPPGLKDKPGESRIEKIGTQYHFPD